ncbi:MAG: hypothetical protein ACO31D_02350 [Ilumatobacteraceae bacterium]
MNKTIDIGLVETTELTKIFDVIWMLRMEGTSIPGVIVHCANGRRVWTISTDELSVVINGDSASFTGAYLLPLTILANAGRQNAANGDCTYTIEGDVVTAHSSLGKQTAKCSSVAIPPTPCAKWSPSRANATLGGSNLKWTFFSGANAPFEAGLSGDDEEVSNPDHFTIEISNDTFQVYSDWTSAKLYPMRGTTSAETSGTAVVNVDPDFLSVIFQCVDSDSTWTISFDSGEPHYIELRSDAFHIIAKMTKVPVVELHERVLRILEREQFEHKTTENGLIGVRLDGVTVSFDFFQRESDETPMARMSTIIARDCNESAELLREINCHNQGGSVVRLWYANSAVTSAIDLFPDSLHSLARRLRHLVREATRLRGVLEPFAAEDALPTRRTRRRRRSSTADRQPEVWD